MVLRFRDASHEASGGHAGISPNDNDLLAALGAPGLAPIEADLQPAYLPRGTSIAEPGSAVTHVFFPARGIVSLGHMAVTGEAAEVAIVGREGVTCVEAFLGAENASHRGMAQTACLGYRLPIRAARSRFAEGGAFYRAVLNYTRYLMMQMSHASICNLHHSLEQRLCRALLQSADRLSSSTVPMTQDVLASLVNARRQGVSEALQKLRDMGLIASARGSIVVLDRARLFGSACECYGIGHEHRQRLVSTDMPKKEKTT